MKILRTFAILLATAVMLFSGYKVLSISLLYRNDRNAYQQSAEQYVQTVPVPVPGLIPEETSPEETTETRPREYAPISVDFDALRQESEDVIAWLYCPDTNISYPVVQSGNNTDYLRAAPDGSYRYAGTLFLDYRCASDFSDHNSIIYGHNLMDNSMFGTLEQYKQQSYYEAHPVMYLLTPEADYRVDLIAGLGLNALSELYRIGHTDESFQEFLTQILAQSDFQTDSGEREISATLTLSTCAYDYSDARYIVVGVLTPLDRMQDDIS